MSDSFFLFSAYIVIWIILFGYVLYLLSKQKEVRKELDILKSEQAEKDPE